MIVPEMTKVAIDKFKQKMAEWGQNLDTQQLTAQLAQQVTALLRDALTAAGASAVQTFVQSYNPTDPLLDVNGWRMRFKMISPKEFLTCFGPMVIERSLYQADTGGRSYVPLDDSLSLPQEFLDGLVHGILALDL